MPQMPRTSDDACARFAPARWIRFADIRMPCMQSHPPDGGCDRPSEIGRLTMALERSKTARLIFADKRKRQPKPRLALVMGTSRMAEYRAYTVGSDGRFIGFEPLVCGDDAEAIEKAKRIVDGHDMELWSGSRLVVRLEASTPKLGSN
jgi:hypothetical protein